MVFWLIPLVSLIGTGATFWMYDSYDKSMSGSVSEFEELLNSIVVVPGMDFGTFLANFWVHLLVGYIILLLAINIAYPKDKEAKTRHRRGAKA